MRVLMSTMAAMLILCGTHLPAGAQTANTAQQRTDAPRQQSDPSNQPAVPSNVHDATAFYPPLSRRLGEQGRIRVSFTIGEDGTVSKPSVVLSSGFDRLDQAALAAVMLWTYHPEMKDGKPIATTKLAEINFSLDDELLPPSTVLYGAAADYPKDALDGKVEGATSVGLLIGPAGNIQRLEFANSSGSQSLDNASIMLVHRSKFAPATVNGVAVSTAFVVTVTWLLPGHRPPVTDVPNAH